jgi:flagellar biosynthesis protein FlhF
MQVKKFEAKTMKEALEMVKNQLGPDAIILGARDNNKSFGLLGKSSVEITAAISDTAMQKRKFAESRMTDQIRQSFRNAPAHIQRRVVDKSVARHTPDDEAKRIPTKIPYADIVDDEQQHQYQQHHQQQQQMGQDIVGRSVETLLQNYAGEPQAPVRTAEEDNGAVRRIRNAAKNAAQVFENQVEKALGKPKDDSEEVRRLREENQQLKKFIEQLQSLPKTYLNTHPGAQHGLSYEVSPMFEKLTEGGISADIASDLMKRAAKEIPLEQQKNKNLIEAWSAHQIMNSIIVADHNRLGRVNAFLGGSGQGKTAALVKLAGFLVGKQKKKVAIIAVGNHKVGAHDQLKIYSHLLNAAFDTVKTGTDWGRVLSQYADYDYILADYPGYAVKNEVELASLKSLIPPFTEERKIHFVQSVLSKDADAYEMMRRYLPIRVDDLILTHLDESANHGLIYNLQKSFNTPLLAFGTGNAVPDDFEWATKERLLDLIFKLTKKTSGTETRNELTGAVHENARSY